MFRRKITDDQAGLRVWDKDKKPGLMTTNDKSLLVFQDGRKIVVDILRYDGRTVESIELGVRQTLQLRDHLNYLLGEDA